MFDLLGTFLSWLLTICRLFWLKFVRIFHQCPILSPSSCQCPERSTEIQKLKRIMPRPKGYPLVGTFFDLIAAGSAPNLHRYIDARHQQLGPIFFERLGGLQDAVFVASASLMRAVFNYEGKYPRHPCPVAWQLYNKQHNCQRGLFFMEDTEWFHNRRILNRFLLSGNLSWMDAPIEACTERVINKWKKKAAKQPNGVFYEVGNLEQQLYRWAIDVICSIMFGSSFRSCSQLDSALDDFSGIVHKIFESSSSLMNFPPLLAKLLNLRIWRNFESQVTEVLQKGYAIIDLFIAQKQQESAIMNETTDSDALFNMLIEAEMPLETIKRIFVDLVVAAGDTTAYTTEFALYLLTQDVSLQKRLFKSLSTDNSSDSEPLIRGLIKETLRLYPIAPFIGRYIATDAVLDGYTVKKNTLVLLSLYTAGRSAEHFPEPLAVKPQRWLPNDETGELQQVLQSHGSMPFAVGNRTCIGRRVAIKQIQCFLGAVIRNFALRCNNSEPIDCVLRLVTVPSQPLQLGIRLRESTC